MRTRLGIVVAVGLFSAACGDDGEPTTATSAAPPTATTAPAAAPGDDWSVAAGAEDGLTEDGLAALVERAEATQSHCMVVVDGGELAIEEYWNGTDVDDDHPVYSTTKSVAAVLIGIAQDQGLLDIEQPASDFLDEWVGTDSEDVTIRSLLQNTSGRDYEFKVDFESLPDAADQSAFALALGQEAPPDTQWFYSNSAIQTVEEVLERATGEDVEAFAREHLFEPLGMDVVLGRDDAGNVGFYSGMEAGCLDLARLMLMVHQGGRWGEDRIVSADFLADATSARTDLNGAYGYLFWLNSDPPWDHTDPRRDRTMRFWPDAPLDTYMASGLGDQMAMVFPSEDKILVRVGPPDGTRGYEGVLANDLAGLFVAALD